MNISLRLKTIAFLVDKCESICDIGTDHAYLPIYLIEKSLCNNAIASDINKGPVEKAKANIKKEGLSNKIICRLGAGLKTIKPNEVDAAIIAGMGGNLIRDIIEESKDVFKNLDYCILQPVQNPDILRKYIYESGYDILDEELCIDEGKYYEIIKIKYNDKYKEVDDIYYEVSKKLIDKKHPLIKDYINFKIDKYKNIVKYIKDNTELAIIRKSQLNNNIIKLEELIKCL
ncbi:SAM-dependent methyltransferase [Clostridium novyi B str. ATCC 27606]|uniref:SAM-dependent methyltransferase n=2 Tax=Clostridium TaxID=1485 RepID=A0AA40IU10_CLONO|nr:MULTISPECIES: class I SAM-dependent methyltransferase [Clostridium]KEI13292.1 SAM-dependent methyltransferase [Clostridium novyi B str. NCTC 9691]KEI15045.1 SAM-dependent methyltransferase [Clostridium haemolyticum NCTC 9693]KEI15947.1 SAM-dependent methyltransferase [Clostridium novyi B str. ATCC 27606]KGN01360.1 SAM-dependent methyltransferase [Clostridium haemolyticum NCTC 8350]OOB76368.1 SAM-dependent methyltransferase [Clostridium haemolyticum]